MEAYRYLALVYDKLMGIDYDAWYYYLRDLLDSKGIQYGHLLDLACGTGQFSLRFSKLKWPVVGVDVSQAMLTQAWDKKQPGLSLEFVHQDMRKLSLGMQFDAVISVCDGFNYLLTKEDLLATLRGVYRHLRPGGYLLFDISSRYKLEHICGDNTFAEDQEGLAYIWQNHWQGAKRLCEMEITLFIQENEKETSPYRRYAEVHVQKGWEQTEIIAALKTAGFVHSEAYTGLTRLPPQSTSDRLQFVAQKPY